MKLKHIHQLIGKTPHVPPPPSPQASVLSPAPTVTRSSARRATGKHTSRLTSKACSRRNTSSPEKSAKPKCPRVTYLCPTSPCRSPSSSPTTVKTSPCFSGFFFSTESAPRIAASLPHRPDPVPEPPPRFSAVPGGQRSSVQVPVLQQSLQEIQPSETARQVGMTDGATGRVLGVSWGTLPPHFCGFLPPSPGLTREKGLSSACSAAGASPLRASSRPTSGPTPA